MKINIILQRVYNAGQRFSLYGAQELIIKRFLLGPKSIKWPIEFHAKRGGERELGTGASKSTKKIRYHHLFLESFLFS